MKEQQRMRLLKANKLQTQIEIAKGVMPDTKRVVVTLMGAVHDVLHNIAAEERSSVDVVAANILSGWCCQVQDEIDAERQKTGTKGSQGERD